MDANTILKLVDAGFTKADILALGGSKAPDQVPDQAPEAPKPEIPTADPKPEQTQPTPQGITLTDDQFRTLLQQANIQGASLDVPPEVDLSTKLGEHFKDLMIGK